MNERGIRATPHGWQVYLHVKGEFRSKHFPKDTPVQKLRDWRKEQQARATLNLKPEPQEADTFGADCEAYLAAVRGMTTYTDRKYRIEQWRDALGRKRRRSEITSVEIRQQLEKWKAAKLSHGSLNLRRTALFHLFTVLDGKSAKNPVKDVPPYREIPPPLRLPTPKDALAAIEAVEKHKGKSRKTRARLLVLLWTGWPAAQLKKLKPGDIDWPGARALVHGRQKGRGTRPKWLPLLPQAVAALKEMKKARAWGEFSNSSLHSRLHQGCKNAKVEAFRVYDLRHLFGTMVAAVVKDDRVVAELLMHADIRMTRRYTEQSVNPRLLEGLALVAKSLGQAR